MISGWRIASPAFSKTPDQMLSGEGARLYGGRWSSPGTRMVYLGSNLSVAAMELLVHLDNAEVLNSYRKLEVSFPEECLAMLDIDSLPEGWDDASTMSPVCQATGDDWVADNTTLALKVPSITVKGDWNYLINPAHPDFEALEVGEITPFNYDPRLAR